MDAETQAIFDLQTKSLRQLTEIAAKLTELAAKQQTAIETLRTKVSELEDE